MVKVLYFVSRQWKSAARKFSTNGSESVMQYALKRGNMGLVLWARENGRPWSEGACSCSCAAHSGNLELLKMAREAGCHWDITTFGTAASRGHLEVLKFVMENGCPWITSLGEMFIEWLP